MMVSEERAKAFNDISNEFHYYLLKSESDCDGEVCAYYRVYVQQRIWMLIGEFGLIEHAKKVAYGILIDVILAGSRRSDLINADMVDIGIQLSG